MADITAELAALPKMPNYAEHAHWKFDELRGMALEARLALAERRYAELANAAADTLAVHAETTCCAVTRQRVAEARAYLAHRAKEQP